MKSPNRRHAFTLIEVMVGVTIVMTAAIGIASTILFGLEAQQAIRERNGATRLAAQTLETTRRAFLTNLESSTVEGIIIDDRGTPNREDDIRATLELRFFDRDRNEVGTLDHPVPANRNMLIAEATVTWTPAGRRGSTDRSVVMTTFIAP